MDDKFDEALDDFEGEGMDNNREEGSCPQAFIDRADKYFRMLVSPQKGTASKGMQRLRELRSKQWSDLLAYMKRFKDEDLTKDRWRDVRTYIENNKRKCYIQPDIQPGKPGEIRIKHADIIHWLDSDKTQVWLLEKSKCRTILSVVVDSEDINPRMKLDALWFNCNNYYHLIVISSEHGEQERVNKILNMLEYMDQQDFNHKHGRLEYTLMNKKESSWADSVSYGLNYGENAVPYYEAQQRREQTEKRQAAQYLLSKQLNNLSQDAGLIFDAGTSCASVCEELFNSLLVQDIHAFYAIATNSSLVVQRYWQMEVHPKIQGIQLYQYGSQYNREEGAYFDSEIDPQETKRKLLESNIRFTHAFIGVSSMQITRDGELLLSVHGKQEIATKELLFKGPWARYILLSPSKIGKASGLVFDVLKIDGINTEAPIFMVSVKPGEEDKENSERFCRTMKNFESKRFEEAVREKGLEIHWLTGPDPRVSSQDGRNTCECWEDKVVPLP